ncbi:MAG: hypothetical protein DRJ42_03150 [Deltaproteobacteria bacterium]|nr:MAG: hypothetical protein DRJ42_03150 [Deltaproteobacteria bacterium]
MLRAAMTDTDYMAPLRAAFDGEIETEVVRAELWDGGRLRVRRDGSWSTSCTLDEKTRLGLTAHLLDSLELDEFPALPSAFVAEASSVLGSAETDDALRVHLGSIPDVGPLAVFTVAPRETVPSAEFSADEELTSAWEEAMSCALARLEDSDTEACFAGLDEAVTKAEAMGSAGDAALGITLSHIGHLRLEDNRPDLARAALERAVTLDIEGEAPDILVERLHLLAMTCARMSEPTDAISALELAVSILSAAFGPEDLGLHPLLVDIASLAQDGGDPGASQAALDQWQAIRASVLEA